MVNPAFVMEQTLGHVTHHQNLARFVSEDGSVCPHWVPIEPSAGDVWDRIPVVRSNWSLKASLRARDALRGVLRSKQVDVLFLHTQTVALFAVPFMRRIPTLISLDATPLNYDAVGAEYGHGSRLRWLERRKYLWNRATFHEAAALVTWCRWAKQSLVDDYGVPADRVTVIPPGVDLRQWTVAPRDDRSDRPLRLLFVGGDFRRKGGQTLLETCRAGLNCGCELDVVTREEVPAPELDGLSGVRVHRGLTANSAPLRDLYARADIFVFPTLADCLPIAVMEAMAAGLPVVTTTVGALGEEVEDGVNGLLVPPGDSAALLAAVRALQCDAAMRRQMGLAGRRMAEARFDARRNYGAVVGLMKAVAADSRSFSRTGVGYAQ